MRNQPACLVCSEPVPLTHAVPGTHCSSARCHVIFARLACDDHHSACIESSQQKIGKLMLIRQLCKLAQLTDHSWNFHPHIIEFSAVSVRLTFCFDVITVDTLLSGARNSWTSHF